jgi:hypothetical protein
MGKTPRIFVSSTIYDFRDFRSALKYYLEGLGFEVLLSEFNDFTKDLDLNSFEACLKSIEQVDYYILFVGNRVGGYYDATQRISITQKEYRAAYSLAKERKVKLLLFVRRELWDIREDRKALRKHLEEGYLKNHEISADDIISIANHKSNMVNDAEFLFSFISEISRRDEMTEATSHGEELPPANWIHTFNTFRDVTDTLRAEFRFGDDLSKVALVENLKHELLVNLLLMSYKTKDGIIVFEHNIAEPARKFYKGGFNDTSMIPSRCLANLRLFFILGVGRPVNMGVQFIDYALTTGQFLEYDKESCSYKAGSIHEALLKLKSNIESLKGIVKLFEAEQLTLIKKYAQYDRSEAMVSVGNQELYIPFVFYDCLVDIKNISIALLKELRGETGFLDRVPPRATSPLREMAEAIKREYPTLKEIETFVADYTC